MKDILRQTIRQNSPGNAIALPSVCSAHPDVLAASLLLAREFDRPLIVEATSNQVNQDGVYTNMRAADFIAFVHDISDATGYERERIIFGGDHLGPQVWRKQSADIAMKKAEVLVAEYVAAGFTKIHLDCSEGCDGEPAQVDDEVSAKRAARLAAICEQAVANPETLTYIVGTEVPPPGGARHEEDTVIHPTSPDNAKATLLKHYEAFDAIGISAAKSRISALVVQPGVEFSPEQVHHLPKGGNAPLREMLDAFDDVRFEAHSTDYQYPSAYIELAEMGFAIHKVGPALTFAYRQAVYALDALLDVIQGDARTATHIPDVMEDLMLGNPTHWVSHYQGDEQNLRLLRHFSYADRIRYYWTQPDAQQAITKLLHDVDHADIPMPVWRQFFCPATQERAAKLSEQGYGPAKSLLLAEIQIALIPYFFDVKTGESL